MTDFEKIFNTFKEVGIKMIVAKDKSQIILLEGAEAGCETIYVGEWEFVNGDKDADGYCGFYCKFYFDEEGNSDGFGVFE